MRIVIMVEGATETAFKPHLQKFLQGHLSGKMPKLVFIRYDGRIPTKDKLKRQVENLLRNTVNPPIAVIALTDVYTGSTPREFETADDAKRKMREWVGDESRFHPHVALHDFEAWLLPYWDKIQKLTGNHRTAPGPNPEQVNHDKPPANRLAEIYRTGTRKRHYIKTRDANSILNGENLIVAVQACSELKAFVNTILKLCDKKKLIL